MAIDSTMDIASKIVEEDWPQDRLSGLIAQLHYDRADVAQLSSSAAAAMDIAIMELMTVVEALLANLEAGLV